MIEIINKPLLLHLVGYLYYWQMGFNSVFKGLIVWNSRKCLHGKIFRTLVTNTYTKSIVYSRSQGPRGVESASAAARLLGLRVWIPPTTRISVFCEFYVLLGWGLCDRPITCPEESYRQWCVWVW